MLDAQWIGKDDIVRVRTEKGSLEVHYWELLRVLEMFTRHPDWPAACPTCKGEGKVAFPIPDPVDFQICPTCDGHRIAPRARVAP